MGCDSQFDYLYETSASRERSLQASNKLLRRELAVAEAKLRGY